MPWQLRSYDVAPPGNYPFEQFDGIYRKFPATPYPEAQAQNILSFRQKNNLPRATLQESLLDLGTYTCQRLGNMSAYCINTDNPVPSNSPMVAQRGCRGCGAPMPLT